MRVLLLLAALILASCGSFRPPQPSPALTPAEVVSIQLRALQNINQPVPNAGVWIVYQFASPGNRQVTGPYGRFLRMIKSPANRTLLRSRSLKIVSSQVSGAEANVAAEVTGDAGAVSEWVFTLSKLSFENCAGCWMTEGVSRTR